MADGFLGRWAQRKQAVREGKAVEPPAAPPTPTPATAPVRSGETAAPVAAAPVVEPPPPPPTLEDTRALTPQSDFQRFVAPDVDPAVKNAAMKKLFADPHFNVMDRLDIYIDDYSQPDPLPLSMLRQMASAQFLGLVEEEKKPAAEAAAVADNSAQPAASAAAETAAPAPDAVAAPAASEPPETEHHADPDLRLQQDHAAGPQGSGGSAQ